MLHSRKELRRNTERDGAEGRRASERGEKKREGGEKRGNVGSPPLFAFFFALSQALKRCLIWSVGSREVDSLVFFFFLPTISRLFFPPLSLPWSCFPTTSSRHASQSFRLLCDIFQTKSALPLAAATFLSPPTGVALVKRTPISTLWCFTVLLVDFVHA